MSILLINSICPFALSEEDGSKVYSVICDHIEQKNKICVDFKGISLFATPFFNTSLGAAIVKFGVGLFDEYVEVANLDDLGQETYRHSRESAVSFKENKQSKQVIAEIVKRNIKGD